uniref:Uncharacterized protein n=1 Tax=Caenorhabditis japonica TaxID=281687 RepID=A0A8R1EMW3_CAEJA
MSKTFRFPTVCRPNTADSTNSKPTTSSKSVGDHVGYMMSKTFRFPIVCPPTTVHSASLSSISSNDNGNYFMNKKFRFPTLCRPNTADSTNSNNGIKDMQTVIGMHELFAPAGQNGHLRRRRL